MNALTRNRPVLDLEAKLALLRQPQTYPEHPQRIETIETHMSWVFLTEHHAYKLKKPVRYGFLDFSTLAARRKNCAEEVRLNRHLAPGVYLGVVALAIDAQDRVRLEAEGEAVEWLVKMRRLPAERMLDYRIQHNLLESVELHELAEWLAHFYRERVPLKMSGEEYCRNYENNIRINHEGLADAAYGLPAALIESVHEAQQHFLQRSPELVGRRAEDGRIVEGHGDLRPEHVCLKSPLVIFDRLEFNRAFRIIDVADELAFLAMECERLGAPQVERELFQAYHRVTGDHPPPPLVCFYKTYRACLRARLAIWHVHELAESDWPRWQTVAEEYLLLAENYSEKL